MHVEWLTSFIILLLLANKETARYMRIFFAGVEWSGHFCWCTQRLLFSDSNVMITDLWMKTESISRGSPVFSQWMVGPLTSMAEPLEEAWLLIPKQQQHISTVTLAAESATSWWWDINHLQSLPSWWAGWWSFQSLVFGFSAVDDSLFCWPHCRPLWGKTVLLGMYVLEQRLMGRSSMSCAEMNTTSTHMIHRSWPNLEGE